MAARAVSFAEQNGFTAVAVMVFYTQSSAQSRAVYENLQSQILERCPGVEVATDFVEPHHSGNGKFILNTVCVVCMCSVCVCVVCVCVCVCVCMCVCHSRDLL